MTKQLLSPLSKRMVCVCVSVCVCVCVCVCKVPAFHTHRMSYNELQAFSSRVMGARDPQDHGEWTHTHTHTHTAPVLANWVVDDGEENTS